MLSSIVSLISFFGFRRHVGTAPLIRSLSWLQTIQQRSLDKLKLNSNHLIQILCDGSWLHAVFREPILLPKLFQPLLFQRTNRYPVSSASHLTFRFDGISLGPACSDFRCSGRGRGAISDIFLSMSKARSIEEVKAPPPLWGFGYFNASFFADWQQGGHGMGLEKIV